MAKTRLVEIKILAVEGLPDSSVDAGQIQIRYGLAAATTTVKRPLRRGHSSDIMETFSFPVDGPALQFDVMAVKSDGTHPTLCSGGHVIKIRDDYLYDGPVELYGKTTDKSCVRPKLYVTIKTE